MRLQAIQNVNNYNNYNPNFKAIKFGYHTQDISSWEPRILDKFLYNLKIQEFIKTMHKKGKDILATDNQIFKDGKFVQTSFNIDVLDRYTNTIEYSIRNMTPEDLADFSVEKTIADYNKKIKDQSPYKKYVLEFIKNFNDSL